MATNVFAGGWAVTVLNALATGSAISPPANVYVALLTNSPFPTSDTATLTEFQGYTSATRPAVTFGTASVASGQTYQSVSSNAAVSFTMNSGATVTGIAIVTTDVKATGITTGSGGNVIWFGDITSVTVSSGNVLTFSSGDITVRLY